MKTLLIISALLFSFSSHSKNYSIWLPMISKNIDFQVHKPKNLTDLEKRDIYIVIPGLNDNINNFFYKSLVKRLTFHRKIVIIFSWKNNFENIDPSDDSNIEYKLLLTALSYSPFYLNIRKIDQLNFISKSFGSRVFSNWKLTHYFNLSESIVDKINQNDIILTPNCDADSPIDQKYQSLLKSGNKNIVLISKKDPYCKYSQLKHSKLLKKNAKLILTKGNHHFHLKNKKETLMNLSKITKFITNWVFAENKYIYKVLKTHEWEQFQKDGIFKGAPIDIKDGFIHLSTKSQYLGVISRYFKGEDKVFIVKFKTKDYLKNIKYEYSKSSDDHYPHLYDGPLLLNNVAGVKEHKL